MTVESKKKKLFDKARTETLTDGVFAIVMTILVIQLIDGLDAGPCA